MSSAEPPTRERILAATRKLLVEGGGAGIRMADVARAAGVSRQTLYLHFANRTDLLVATTVYVDDQEGVPDRARRYRTAATALEALREFVAFWGRYIEVISPVGSVLLAARDTDEAARAAWGSRMALVRAGCETVVRRLAEEGLLDERWEPRIAGDLLFAIVSMRTWEILTEDFHWSTDEFVERMRVTVERALLRSKGGHAP